MASVLSQILSETKWCINQYNLRYELQSYTALYYGLISHGGGGGGVLRKRGPMVDGGTLPEVRAQSVACPGCPYLVSPNLSHIRKTE